MNSKLTELYARVKSIKPADTAHDFSHMLRVSELTTQIYSQEVKKRENRSASTAELDACVAAALLHDCVPIPKNSPLRKESSRLASETARHWLTELKWDKDQMNLIVNAILTHSYSAGSEPSSLLGEALQDADRLEALGALGLFRTIATGVSMGAELFDTNDPWAEHRSLDDKKYTIDHFYLKLLKLPLTFKTEAAKMEAEKRAQFLEQFLIQLRAEITTGINQDSPTA